MSRFYQAGAELQRRRRCRSSSSPTTATCVVNPITLTQLDEQGIAERYDIVVDFSAFPVGARIKLVNLLRMRDDGRGPTRGLSLAEALAGEPDDPVVGADHGVPGGRLGAERGCARRDLTAANSCGPDDKSQVPAVLTEQIPIVAPVRTRVVEFGRSGPGDSRDPVTGQCIPDCPEGARSRGPSRSTARPRIP